MFPILDVHGSPRERGRQDGGHARERSVKSIGSYARLFAYCGLAWRDEMELRRAGFASRRRAEKAVRHGAKVKVIIVDLADWQTRYFGRAAG